jgi:hypothetical protein
MCFCSKRELLGEVFKQRAREMANFYSWKKIDDNFRINIKKNAVSQRVNRMGKFSLFLLWRT